MFDPWPRPPRLQRATGDGRLSVVSDIACGQRLDNLRQQGAAKILLPRNHVDARMEAVLLNTAGGLTGGDRFSWDVKAGDDTTLAVTTQTAERVYRSSGGDARVDTTLSVGAGAMLEWLPQETILFDGGRLARTLTIDLNADASLLAAETIVLGRRAHGEKVRSGMLKDHWRIRCDGRLIHAEAVRLTGDIASLLDRPATFGGAQAFASILVAGPARLPIDRLRAMLPESDGLDTAASALPQVTLIRLVAVHGDVLRPALATLLRGLRGVALPRVWQE